MNSFKKALSADNPCVASYNFSGEETPVSFFELMTHNDVSKQYPAMAKEPHCHNMFLLLILADFLPIWCLGIRG